MHIWQVLNLALRDSMPSNHPVTPCTLRGLPAPQPLLAKKTKLLGNINKQLCNGTLCSASGIVAVLNLKARAQALSCCSYLK
jgi:hypothetical protein